MRKGEFKIFKEGRTDGKITILSKDESFGKSETLAERMKFYLSLGYQVFDMNDVEIKSVY